MTHQDKLSESSNIMHLESTFAFLETLKTETTFLIASNYPTINKIKCKVKMVEEGRFFYEADDFNNDSSIPPAEFQNDAYGFTKPFFLVNENLSLKVPFGVGKFSIKFVPKKREGRLSGELHEIEPVNVKGFFYRCKLTLKQGIDNLGSYFLSENFKVGNSLRVAGLVKIKVKGIDFTLFDFEVDNVKSFYIDCAVKCDYDFFKSVVNIFIVQNGLISGELMRGPAIILFSEDKEFKQIKQFSSLKLGESKRGLRAVKPSDLIRQYPALTNPEDRYLSPTVMENLITLALEDTKFLRACTIIVESHVYPLEIRASTYSVALETIKNIILLENEEKINPIKSKAVSKKLVAELKTVVEQYETKEFNDKDAVLQKIQHLNQVPNTAAFIKIFDLLGLKLLPGDIEVLKKRNDFLHGRIPFEEERLGTNKNEIVEIVVKLHLLLCTLIMKRAGYNGYFINNIRIIFPEKSEEPIYRRFC